jgi:hypothetical protein
MHRAAPNGHADEEVGLYSSDRSPQQLSEQTSRAWAGLRETI